MWWVYFFWICHDFSFFLLGFVFSGHIWVIFWDYKLYVNERHHVQVSRSQLVFLTPPPPPQWTTSTCCTTSEIRRRSRISATWCGLLAAMSSNWTSVCRQMKSECCLFLSVIPSVASRSQGCFIVRVFKTVSWCSLSEIAVLLNSIVIIV